MSRRPKEFATDYIRAPSFTDEINGEMVPLTFKLPILQAYDGRDDPEDHLCTLISALSYTVSLTPLSAEASPSFYKKVSKNSFGVYNL